MITMAEIAQRAGVSRATASLVINDRDTMARISTATRARVLAVAEEMGYRRNELARAVVTGKNFVFGLLERQSGLEQRARIMAGALAAADAHGYHIKVWPWPDQDELADVARRCVEQRLAGLIVVRPADANIEGLHTELTRYGIPMVLADDRLEQPWAHNVASDDGQGSRQAMEHLLAFGHRRIACIGGMEADPLSVVRQQTYREVMKEHELPTPAAYTLDNLWSFAGTEMCVRHLFNGAAEPPTALFVAAGDSYAAVAVRLLRRMGITVPGEVSVVGYAGLGLAELIDPPLTTISQPFGEIGRVAVEVLIAQIAGGGQSVWSATHLLPTSLISRGSTAPVARAATQAASAAMAFHPRSRFSLAEA